MLILRMRRVLIMIVVAIVVVAVSPVIDRNSSITTVNVT